MLLLFVQSLVASCNTEEVSITTKLGVIHGRKLGSAVSEFLGIPFANAPRWLPPNDWNQSYSGGSLNAKSFGPSCPQPVTSDQIWNPLFTSEECLSLNVWCPRSQPRGGPRPVMFFIFGGGFTSGGSNPYNGSHLAERQNICVVASNYRVGALGFLAQPHAPSSGVLGILDQQSALRWVQQYIGDFGGDTSRVQIAGQSAGHVQCRRTQG